MASDKLTIKGARVHNLKNISLTLPRNKLVVITGLSGSGKSSLAFDTIYAEGQRRYVESLSAYARQFLELMQKPDVDYIEGLSPAISIDQKAHSRNPRSTVATITEIYDYMRVLFARIGKPHCPICGKAISRMSVDEMVDLILRRTDESHRTTRLSEKTSDARKSKSKQKGSSVLVKENEIAILAPVVRGRKGEYHQLLQDLFQAGFLDVRVNGKMFSLRERIPLARYKTHTIDVVIDRIPLAWPIKDNKQIQSRLTEAIELALDRANDSVIAVLDDGSEHVMSARFACPDDGFAFPEIEPRLFSFNSPYGACQHCNGLGTQKLFSEEP